MTLEIKGAPDAPATEDKIECEKKPLQMLTATATPPTNGSIVWYDAATNGTEVSSPTHKAVGSVTYYAETIGANGCKSLSLNAAVLEIKSTPDAPSVNVTNNCDGSSDLTASNYTGTLLWSTGSTSSSIHVTNAASYSVTQTLSGCTSAAGSGTSAPKVRPQAPVLSKVDNCDGTTTITAQDVFGKDIAANELTWSDNKQSGNPIIVSTTASISATRTINECPSASSNVITPAARTTPQAPILSKEDNCNQTTTITAKDKDGNLVPPGELTWSSGGVTNPLIVSTTTAVNAIRTVNGCQSISSSSITPAPKTTPPSPKVSVTNNCDGSSDLTASNYTGTLLWSTGSTSSSIHVTNAASYSVTQTLSGCTSAAGSGTSAPKSNPAAPVLLISQPSLCGPTTGSLEVCRPVTGYLYKIGNTEITAQSGQQVKFDNLAPGSNPSVKVVSTNGCEAITSCSSAVLTCPTEGTKAIATAEESESSNLKIANIDARIGFKTKVQAVPNPYTDKIRFTIESTISGQGSLDIYNTLGQKIHTIYEGYIGAGQVLVKEYMVPANRRTNLIYVFRVGSQKTSGKLLNW